MPESFTHRAFAARATELLAQRDAADRLHVPIPCACFNVRKASRAISHMYDVALQPVGLRGTQYSLLVAISYVGHEGISTLSDVLYTDRTTLSRNLRPLMGRGWVEAVQNTDARKRAVQLTDEGRAILDAAIPLWEAAQRRFVEGLGEESIESLQKLGDEIVSLAEDVE